MTAWTDFGEKTNSFGGQVTSGAEIGGHGIAIGSNLAIYTRTAAGGLFQGNKYVSVMKLSEVGKVGGYFFFGASTLYEGVQTIRGSPGTSVAKWGTDTGVGGAAIWLGGIPGGLLGGTYFLVDEYYPGGWGGFMTHTSGDCSFAAGKGIPCP